MHTVILLALLSFPATMTVSPTARNRRRKRGAVGAGALAGDHPPLAIPTPRNCSWAQEICPAVNPYGKYFLGPDTCNVPAVGGRNRARWRFFPLLHLIFSYYAEGCTAGCMRDHYYRISHFPRRSSSWTRRGRRASATSSGRSAGCCGRGYEGPVASPFYIRYWEKQVI
jgi:hypothetical protein